MKKVLITGMSGLIGGLLRRHLENLGGYELRALNRRPVDGVECYQADIADLDAIRPAFEGIDVVVHLAAFLGGDDWEGQLSGNVIGVYNVYEAARLAGVKRVVFGSSGATVQGFLLVILVGVIAGIGVSAALIAVARRFWESEFAYVSLSVPGWALVLGVVVGVILTLAATIRPGSRRSSTCWPSKRTTARGLADGA